MGTIITAVILIGALVVQFLTNRRDYNRMREQYRQTHKDFNIYKIQHPDHLNNE